MIKTILFDLDGTLLPMWQKDYMTAYFTALRKKGEEHGYDGEQFMQSMRTATGMMMRGDGNSYNKELFWKHFGNEHMEAHLEAFYKNEFKSIKSCLMAQVDRAHLVKTLRERGYKVVLATNPVFPLVAVEERLNWIGLTATDFDHVTTYENSKYCKPSEAYFKEAACGEDFANCIMIGNNTDDDMGAAKCGIRSVLVTDFIEGEDIGTDYERMTFVELEKMLLSM